MRLIVYFFSAAAAAGFVFCRTIRSAKTLVASIKSARFKYSLSFSALAEKSKARVAKEPEFKKIQDELAKTKEKGKIIKLSEVLKDKEKKDKEKKQKALKTAAKAEKDKE